MTPELVTSLGTLLVGIIGASTALILALRKRITEEEVPELRRRIGEVEAERDEEREQVAATRRDVLLLDRYVYALERTLATHGHEPPPRPAPVDAAVVRSKRRPR